MWFSDLHTWNSEDPERYNEHYLRHIQTLREHFRLKKADDEQGVEINGDKILYTFHGHQVIVQIERLEWDNVIKPRGEDYMTPKISFLLRLEFDEDVPEKHKVFFHKWVICQFPERYPSKPPLFKVKEWKYTFTSWLGDNHEHHMYPMGWLCILIDWSPWKDGNYWENSAKDTIATAFEAAISLIVEHYLRFGF